MFGRWKSCFKSCGCQSSVPILFTIHAFLLHGLVIVFPYLVYLYSQLPPHQFLFFFSTCLFTHLSSVSSNYCEQYMYIVILCSHHHAVLFKHILEFQVQVPMIFHLSLQPAIDLSLRQESTAQRKHQKGARRSAGRAQGSSSWWHRIQREPSCRLQNRSDSDQDLEGPSCGEVVVIPETCVVKKRSK